MLDQASVSPAPSCLFSERTKDFFFYFQPYGTCKNNTKQTWFDLNRLNSNYIINYPGPFLSIFAIFHSTMTFPNLPISPKTRPKTPIAPTNPQPLNSQRKQRSHIGEPCAGSVTGVENGVSNLSKVGGFSYECAMGDDQPPPLGALWLVLRCFKQAKNFQKHLMLGSPGFGSFCCAWCCVADVFWGVSLVGWWKALFLVCLWLLIFWVVIFVLRCGVPCDGVSMMEYWFPVTFWCFPAISLRFYGVMVLQLVQRCKVALIEWQFVCC